MMNAFAAVFEARNPEPKHFRSYRVEEGTDLLGDWIFEITFGRIGTFGTSIRHAVCNAEEAQRLVRKNLQRRSSAPKRIGCPYWLTALRTASNLDTAAWLHRRKGYSRPVSGLWALTQIESL